MKEKTDDGKELTTKADHKEQILEYLSWLIKPFSPYYEVYDICKATSLSREEVVPLLRNLEAERSIFPLPVNTGKRNLYMVMPGIQLQLLMKIKNSRHKPSYAFPPSHPSKTNWRKEEWVICIQTYLTGKESQVEMPYYVEYAPIRCLLMHMPSIPEWLPFFKKIPLEVVNILFHEYKCIWSSELLPPDMTCLNNGYLENEKLPADRREKYKAEFALYQYILSGRLREVPQNISADIPEGMCMHAIYHQYRRNLSESLELYSKALKELGVNYFDDALPNLFYTIALINDFTPESKKKLEDLFKRNYLPGHLLPAQLLGLYALHEKLDDTLKHIGYAFNDFPPVTKVLICLLIRHFHFKTNIQFRDEEIWQIIDDKNLKLLQLECFPDLAPCPLLHNRLEEELGLSPILPPFHQTDEWERVLNLLMEKAREIPPQNKEKKKEQSQSRIIYRVNQYNHIHPYLQKSKDGTTWSKGRAISLTTFQQGMPEMNATDRILATYVRFLPNNWYEKKRPLLFGPQPLMLLTGYPLVFSDEHPDIPVDIRKEEPQITVTRIKEGFKIESNVDPDKTNGNYMLKKENDSLLRIIELSPFQRDVMINIARVPVFPPQAEKRLTGLLRELSRNITVHSDLTERQEESQTA